MVRKIAKEHHLSINDLEKIPTSGNQGRLTKKDVLKYLKLTPSEDNFSTSKKLDLPISMEDTVKPMVGIRKKAAAILEQSYREIPHVTTIVEVDVTAMVAQRNTEKKKFFEEYGLKLTYTHYCFYALLQALKKYPALNSWYNQDEWIWKKAVNLGFATSLPDDILVVPNIQNASNLSFHELVSQINSKAQKAKENKLQASDFENTTITVSNTGIFGSLMGTPIISKPQVCVLALGEIRDHFSYNEKQEFIKSKKMHLSMSYDHRVINGAIASKFLSEVKQQLSESNI